MALGTTPDSLPVQPKQADSAAFPWWWNAAVGLLVLGLVLAISFPTVADPDLWGHVRYGQDSWETRDLLRPDPYSYLTAGQPWINHAWLAALSFYLAYALGGAPGLIALKSAITLLIAALGYRHLRQRGLTPAAAGLLLALTMPVIIPGLIAIRPQAYTYLCFLLLLLIIVQADEGRPAWLWAGAPLFALWVNLHGGFLAGAAVLLAWSAVRLVNLLLKLPHLGALLSRAHLLAALPVPLSLAATLLNPYGLDHWRFLLRTATGPRPEIQDWQPIEVATTLGAFYLLLLVVAWLGLIYSRRRRSLAQIAVFACLSVAPLTAVRHVVLFGLAALVLAGEHVADLLQRAACRQLPPATGSKAAQLLRPWVASICCLGALLAPAVQAHHLRCIRLSEGIHYPLGAVALLRKSGVSGNLAVDFNWGQYVLWHLGPRILVSVDGRRETVYSDEIYHRNLAFMDGRGEWDALLERHPTDLALVWKARPAYNLMKLRPGWLLLYEDEHSALFARECSPAVPLIGAVDPPPLLADGAGLCFP